MYQVSALVSVKSLCYGGYLFKLQFSQKSLQKINGCGRERVKPRISEKVIFQKALNLVVVVTLALEETACSRTKAKKELGP
jgi:hypothetical protein